MMRTSGAVLAMLCCCALVPAAFAGEGFVGDWEIKQEFRGQERVSTLSVTEADGKLVGKWISQRGETELADLKATDGKLTFTRSFERQGQSFDVNCEASIVDGKLMGKMITPRGEREFVGIAKSAEPTFIGSWDIEIDFQGQIMEATLDVSEKDGKVAGFWSSQLGDTDLEDIKIEDGEMTFSRTVNAQGQEMDLAYAAKLEGGKLAGTISSEMGDIPFTGTMAKADEPAGGTEAERAAAMVKQLDGNGDDVITEDEAPEQMKQFFGMIDQNADGHIDASEMIMVIQFMDQQGQN